MLQLLLLLKGELTRIRWTSEGGHRLPARSGLIATALALLSGGTDVSVQ